jgi:hypothetical protein
MLRRGERNCGKPADELVVLWLVVGGVVVKVPL